MSPSIRSDSEPPEAAPGEATLESGPVPARQVSVAPGAKGAAWLGRELAGRVRLVAHVADGARGHLFRGERTSDGATVAVKVMRAGVLQTQSRFESALAHEARIAARVRHPHALRVTHCGHAGSHAMFVEMEWLEGYSLDEALDTYGPLPEGQALLLASQTCRALKSAHHDGVVHGDLGPSSLFLHRMGERAVVKVMDFGRQRVAAWTEEGASQVSLPTGWARYLAPEQITGADYDARADIYALGAVLYQALSGELPFQDTTGIGIFIAQVNETPRPLREQAMAATVRAEVEDLVMCCLARDPGERFPSAGALLAAVDALRRDGPSERV